MSNFYDLSRLFEFRGLLRRHKPDSLPQASVLGPPPGSSGRFGIFPGSFNPPTLAHLELARRARESFNLDRVFFTVSAVTVDKERIEGLILEDRLLLLSLLAEELGWASAAVVSHGLYFEQAKAFRSLLGNRARISFIVGMDKLIQIFDARYYREREAALKDLLTEAQVLVAMRGRLGMAEMEQVLGRRENEPYRDRVFPFSLPAELADLSSSFLRSAIARGEPVQDKVPNIAAGFLSEAGAYHGTYETRVMLLERLYQLRERFGTGIDFRRLLESARDDSSKGAELRELLKSPVNSAEAFEKFVSG